MHLDRYRVRSGTEVSLDDWDPDDHEDLDHDDGDAALASTTERLGALQDVLYAQAEHKVLVVLQGMDTSGKDGTISHVFHAVAPSGVHVTSFGVPTETELAHDYLWRVHPHVPPSGHIAIFNRSHYEDVLVVRVHDLVPEARWRRRYRHIREFERMLADEGTVIRKFFLHISPDEQRERLQARLDDPDKNWKFRTGDLEERRRWPAYQRAYEDALSETSTDDAPWYVIPANHKWFRNLLISRLLVDALEGLDLRYPDPEPGLEGLTVE